MAEGTKLASGYVELNIESAHAMKQIVSNLTGLQGTADKVGIDMGRRLGVGIAKDAEKHGEQYAAGFAKAAGGKVDASGKKMGDSLVTHATKSGDTSGAAFVTSMAGALGLGAPKIVSEIEKFGLSGKSKAMLAGVGLGTAMAVGVAEGFKHLMELGETFKQISNDFVIRTGAMGDQLKGFVDVVKGLGPDSSASLGQIADVASRVAQTLHLTGEPLKAMTKNLTDLREMGMDVDVTNLAKAFHVMGVNVEKDGVSALNQLLTASRATGVPMNSLVDSVVSAGKATKEFGLDFGQTANLITNFTKAGLDQDKVKTGLTLALKNMSKDSVGDETERGKIIKENAKKQEEYNRKLEEHNRQLANSHGHGLPPLPPNLPDLVPVPNIGPAKSAYQQLVDKIGEIARLSHGTLQDQNKAVVEATKLFGKSYIDFFDAIKDGTLDVASLNTEIGNTGPNIEDTRKQTETWRDEWHKLKNQLETELEPAAKELFNTVNAWVRDHKEDIKKIFEGAIETAKDLLKAMGPITDLFGRYPGLIAVVAGAFVAWESIKGVTALITALTTITTLIKALPAIAAASAAGITAGFATVTVSALVAALMGTSIATGSATGGGNDVNSEQPSAGGGTPPGAGFGPRAPGAPKIPAGGELVPNNGNAPPGQVLKRYPNGAILPAYPQNDEERKQMTPPLETPVPQAFTTPMPQGGAPGGATPLPQGVPQGAAPGAFIPPNPSREQTIQGITAAARARGIPDNQIPGILGVAQAESNFGQEGFMGFSKQTADTGFTGGAQWANQFNPALNKFLDNYLAGGFGTGGGEQAKASAIAALNSGNPGPFLAWLQNGVQGAVAGQGGMNNEYAGNLSKAFSQYQGGLPGGGNGPSAPSGPNPLNQLPIGGGQAPSAMGAPSGNSGKIGANPDSQAARVAAFLGGSTTDAVNAARAHGVGLNPIYPLGTNTGGYGNSKGLPQWAIDLGNKYGLAPSTYPEGGTLHQQGFAMDFAPKPGNTDPAGSMDRFSQFIMDDLMSQTLELIHSSGTGGPNDKKWGIAGGRAVGPGTNMPGYNANDWGGHSDVGSNAHVHWATDKPPLFFDEGGMLPPGAHMVINATGKPELVLNDKQQQEQAGKDNQPGKALRTKGYIPAGAGGKGQAGTSFASGLYNMAADVLSNMANKAIDAGSMGMGGMMGGDVAKQVADKGIHYGFQMAGIWTDALAEIFMPFGVPRLFQTDPTQFMPHPAESFTAQTTGEKSWFAPGAPQGDANTPALGVGMGIDPGGPVQPGQLPGQQPIAPPVPAAKPEGVPSAPTPVDPGAGGAPGGPQAPTVLNNPPSLTPQQKNLIMPDQGPPGQGDKGKPDPTSPKSMLSFLGFDEGGWMMPGDIGINQTGHPEPILSPEQWGNVSAIANRPSGEYDQSSSGGTHHYGPYIENVTVKDVDEFSRSMADRQRLDMMRYGGRPSMSGS